MKLKLNEIVEVATAYGAEVSLDTETLTLHTTIRASNPILPNSNYESVFECHIFNSMRDNFYEECCRSTLDKIHYKIKLDLEERWKNQYKELGGFVSILDEEVKTLAARVVNPFSPSTTKYTTPNYSIYEVVVLAEDVGYMVDEITWTPKQSGHQIHFYEENGEWYAKFITNNFYLGGKIND